VGKPLIFIKRGTQKAGGGQSLPSVTPGVTPSPMNGKHPEDEAAFVLAEGDRFHSIIVSDGVKFDLAPNHETVITFFVIRRHSGLCDIFQVMKTFKGNDCISRNVQSKLNILAGRIDQEIDAIKIHFTEGIRKITGFGLKWNTLNLADTEDRQEQIRRIRAWGRVGVRFATDIPPISEN
jgi:hypothetical protein